MLRLLKGNEIAAQADWIENFDFGDRGTFANFDAAHRHTLRRGGQAQLGSPQPVA